MAQKRFLVISAHPDDGDIRCGGTAIKMAQAGHLVKFVSCCNGDCGHYATTHEALAARRFGEAQAAKEVAGLTEYQVLSYHDCEVQATLELRKEIIRIIRRFQPDVVISHRLCDYHADHRNVAQTVLDAAYLVMVPMFCDDTPCPPKNPVFAYNYDNFKDPHPIRADAVVPIDDIIEKKMRMLDCHVSQFYEWLAYEKGFGNMDASKMSWEERRTWLMKYWGQRSIDSANAGRDQLVKVYGEAGKAITHAEIYEFSPYGAKVTPEEFQALFTC